MLLQDWILIFLVTPIVLCQIFILIRLFNIEQRLNELTGMEQEDIYKYLLNGAESLVKEHPDLVRDIWNCSSCEHTEDECKDCYPELGYKNDKARRDTEAVKEFVEGDTFEKLMKSLDKQDRAATEDAEQFLRDIKAKEQEE